MLITFTASEIPRVLGALCQGQKPNIYFFIINHKFRYAKPHTLFLSGILTLLSWAQEPVLTFMFVKLYLAHFNLIVPIFSIILDTII